MKRLFDLSDSKNLGMIVGLIIGILIVWLGFWKMFLILVLGACGWLFTYLIEVYKQESKEKDEL